jgi:hypothetical protein
VIKAFFFLLIGAKTPGDLAYWQGKVDMMIATAPPCNAFEDNCITIYEVHTGSHYPLGIRAKKEAGG